ncbi:CHC2 zinc finger domain-containing protein, partial [Staphylococcus epidermidis]|uniref:CHC2 zinc finger domain-containing protein n=1 Tax=Staphylococcus epidermidis TaxID=1282 RepID=UPI0021B3EB8C
MPFCTVHHEKTPSVTVSQHKQISHCFRCKKPANLFQFTQQIKDVSFLQPLNHFAQPLNIQLHIPHNQTNSSTKIPSHHFKIIHIHQLIK